jgi:hypothetical protein
MRGLLLVGFIGIAVAGSGAACGDDDALSKSQYVSELSAMCRDFAARELAIGEPTTVADLVEQGPRIVDAFEKAILARVRTLEAPDEIADQAASLADLAVQQRDALADLVAAAKESDLVKVRQLAAKNSALNAEANAITRELGAEGCTDG